MPCKKEENGTLNRGQSGLARYAEVRRNKSLRSRIKTENFIKIIVSYHKTKAGIIVTPALELAAYFQ